MNAFDPFLQIQNRLSSLALTGNAISKCDVRIIGGTWSVYPKKYRDDFVKNIYDAHTLFVSGKKYRDGSLFQKNTSLVHQDTDLSATLEEAKNRNKIA